MLHDIRDIEFNTLENDISVVFLGKCRHSIVVSLLVSRGGKDSGKTRSGDIPAAKGDRTLNFGGKALPRPTVFSLQALSKIFEAIRFQLAQWELHRQLRGRRRRTWASSRISSPACWTGR